jgi:hypothetical protein
MAQLEDMTDHLDGMILKAFRIITRAVKFLDILEESLRSHPPINRGLSAVTEVVCTPPTPPADSASFDDADAGSRRTSQRSSVTDVSSSQTLLGEQTVRPSNKRASASYPLPLHSVRTNRLSLAHRVSTASPSPYLLENRSNLVSERLNSSHDILLSFLGSFIGRLRIQSQMSHDLVLTIRESVSAGRSLLKIVEVVSSHDVQSRQSLQESKDNMHLCINQLVLSARECVRSSSSEEEAVMMPQENASLTDAATDCVIAAGECVAKTRFIIERIGDFELESQSQGLGIDFTEFGTFSNVDDTTTERKIRAASRTSVHSNPILSNAKPLPDVPSDITSQSLSSLSSQQSSDTLQPQTCTIEDPLTPTLNLLPPLPNLTSPLMGHTEYGLEENSPCNDGEFRKSARTDSIAVSTSAASSTYLTNVRDSESSMLSRTSTRATTPDNSPSAPGYHSSFSSLGMTDSQTTLVEEIEEAESKMLEKTYAHELLLNKEGQVIGGTLPALIERLTTHDSIPDATFVSTFYLTFRLFVDPVSFAKALVERFDYVAESPLTAETVRLRVYNVFKGWLESHWRETADHDALRVIEAFAQGKLSQVLPAWGKRLLELVQKVSLIDRPLVPRLVSSMGKTSTSISQYIPPDTPLPPPVMSKGQLATLKNWKMGGNPPTILDFDPLELARQLTIKEMNIFSSIMPEELLAQEWTKKSGSCAINVRAMAQVSTDLIHLVSDTILHYEDAKKRAANIKHWIKVAQKCLELNNYDSLMAIVSALGLSQITRLRKTWDIVSQKRKDVFKSLQDLVDNDRNFAVLRQRLHDHVPPCLPFVGTYLTDLTFVDAGNQATRQLHAGSGKDSLSVINFGKHTRTAKIIGDLQRFQIPYRLAEVPELQEWLQAQFVRVRCSNDSANYQQQYRRSTLLEPKISDKPSPAATQDNFPTPAASKEKFDLFFWAHSKEKSAPFQATTLTV